MSTKRYTNEDIGDTRAAMHRGRSPAEVTRAVAVFYVVAALLNGEHLLRQAELMAYGPARDTCVALARPIAYVSRVSGASQLRFGVRHFVTRWGEDQ